MPPTIDPRALYNQALYFGVSFNAIANLESFIFTQSPKRLSNHPKRKKYDIFREDVEHGMHSQNNMWVENEVKEEGEEEEEENSNPKTSFHILGGEE